MNRHPKWLWFFLVVLVVAACTRPAPPSLEVLETFPADGATGVYTDVVLSARINVEPEEEFLDGAFYLRDEADALVAGTISMDAPAKMVLFTPDDELELDTGYTATIIDTHGDNEPYTWSFTTEVTPTAALRGVSIEPIAQPLWSPGPPVQLQAVADLRYIEPNQVSYAWSSSDPTVLVVSVDGLLSPIGAGEATVTVTASYEEQTASGSLVVRSQHGFIGVAELGEALDPPAGFSGEAGSSYAHTSGDLPGGIVFDPSGPEFRGTPTETGLFSGIVTASRGGESTEIPFTLYVFHFDLVFHASSPSSVALGSTHSFILDISDPEPENAGLFDVTVSWSTDEGILRPDGVATEFEDHRAIARFEAMSLGATELVASVAEDYRPQFPYHFEWEVSMPVTVVAPISTEGYEPQLLLSSSLTEPRNASILPAAVSGGVGGPYHFSLASGSSLPEGLSLDPDTGEIHGELDTHQSRHQGEIVVRDRDNVARMSLPYDITVVYAWGRLDHVTTEIGLDEDVLLGFTLHALNWHGYEDVYDAMELTWSVEDGSVLSLTPIGGPNLPSWTRAGDVSRLVVQAHGEIVGSTILTATVSHPDFPDFGFSYDVDLTVVTDPELRIGFPPSFGFRYDTFYGARWHVNEGDELELMPEVYGLPTWEPWPTFSARLADDSPIGGDPFGGGLSFQYWTGGVVGTVNDERALQYLTITVTENGGLGRSAEVTLSINTNQ